MFEEKALEETMVFPGESFRKDHVLCEEKATKETVVGERHRETMDILYLKE